MNTCRNSRPSGFSQPRTRASRARQFDMCSNISTETMRSKPASPVSKSFMSAVITSRLVEAAPRAPRLDIGALRARVGHGGDAARWESALAMHSDSEPQPQPSSRMRWPSASSACAQVSSSARISASASVVSGRGIEAAGIFARRPEDEAEEVGRQFVMLGVGGLRVQRDRKFAHRLCEFCLRAASTSSIRRAVRPQSQSMPASVSPSGSGARSTASMTVAIRFIGRSPSRNGLRQALPTRSGKVRAPLPAGFIAATTKNLEYAKSLFETWRRKARCSGQTTKSWVRTSSCEAI